MYGTGSNPTEHKKYNIRKSFLWKYKILYLMIVPGILYFIIFKYAPMYGILIAFKKFSFRLGIMNSPWVGLEHFRFLLRNKEFWNVLANTLIISFGKILYGFPVPIILSLFLSELRSHRYKRLVQSVLYLPHFFSWIIVAGLAFNLFSITNGALPKLFASWKMEMPMLLHNPDTFRGFVFMTHVWKTAGWGTIIYLASIAGIDASLYEAATIDGAGRFKKVLYITLPSMSFTIVILLVLNIGQVMNAGFDQIFNLYSPAVYRVGDILDTFVYRKGILGAQFEFGTVVGLFKSVVGCLLLLTANSTAKRLNQESIF